MAAFRAAIFLGAMSLAGRGVGSAMAIKRSSPEVMRACCRPVDIDAIGGEAAGGVHW
ncbi:hypothetical protein [Xanthomonas fragariae]|uniref:hypothetical protein n=1 Tax=Xanthomonas fragariae TaxID=48664 RepID=UPI0003A33880|nr:hypothetical protein [Xanthomonas fragariae]